MKHLIVCEDVVGSNTPQVSCFGYKCLPNESSIVAFLLKRAKLVFVVAEGEVRGGLPGVVVFLQALGALEGVLSEGKGALCWGVGGTGALNTQRNTVVLQTVGSKTYITDY